jgi:hypothetical protein
MRLEKTFQEVLQKDALVPDFAYDKGKGMLLHAAHRRIAGMEVYFVANATSLSANVDCRFRVSGMVPELWHPDSGRTEACTLYQEDNGVTRIPIAFDPSGSVFVVFRAGERSLHAQKIEALESANSLVIKKASYEGKNGVALDVTQALGNRIREGRLLFNGAFNNLGGDPEPYVIKTLKVDYEYNGKPGSVVLKDGDTLVLPAVSESRPPYEIMRRKEGVFLRATQGGNYKVTLSDGSTKTVAVPPIPAPKEITGPWKVEFPKGWGAPDQVKFDRLISWPEHPDEGVKYFSGTAVYSCNFKVDDVSHRLMLDLGRVEVIAKVTINGQPLEVLWKPPFVYDISGKVHAGENSLKVEITNLWPNRLIGDENYPDDCTPNQSWLQGRLLAIPEWLKLGKPRPEPRRLTFTTYKHWKKGDPLLPSGLLGPVTLQAFDEVEVIGH